MNKNTNSHLQEANSNSDRGANLSHCNTRWGQGRLQLYSLYSPHLEKLKESIITHQATRQMPVDLLE